MPVRQLLGFSQPRAESVSSALLGQLSTPGQSEEMSDSGAGQYSVSSPGHSTSLRDHGRLNRCCPQTDYKQTRGQAVTSLAKQAQAPPHSPTGRIGISWGCWQFFYGEQQAENPKPEGTGSLQKKRERRDQSRSRGRVSAGLCMRPWVYSNEVPRVGIVEKLSFRPSFPGI